MSVFFGKDFLLHSQSARYLYHDYAANAPIIDYHCHIEAKDISDDVKFENITQAWLYGDHYKWRAMRNCGVDERLITGNASDYERFVAYATIMPQLVGNPLYYFSHLELQRYFGVTEPLSEYSAERIWDATKERCKDLSARQLIQDSNVEVIVTTDDPDSDLQYHDRLAADGSFDVAVLPCFRPDRLLEETQNLDETLQHLQRRLDYFKSKGCVITDHGFYAFDNTQGLEALAGMYVQRGMSMQLHFGVLRNINSAIHRGIGPNTGVDAIGDAQHASGLATLLDRLNDAGNLPKTIVYSINPNDNAILASIASSFRDVYHGTAWWFNDSLQGIESHIRTLSSLFPLGRFLGMLTDSRSFLSYARHEFFRRILCNYVGELIERGEYPMDYVAAGEIIYNICYGNIKEFLFAQQA